MSPEVDHSATAIQRLEERLAWLQKHITEQDKVILEISDQISRLRRELVDLRERHQQTDGAGLSSDRTLSDERPPHY